jgi:regulator of protease activity HflC (stomatin/prohibitin superfamily)
MSAREELGIKMQQILDKLTDPWGVKVIAAEIKDVELTAELKRDSAVGGSGKGTTSQRDRGTGEDAEV